jgi:chromosome segregation ATPase
MTEEKEAERPESKTIKKTRQRIAEIQAEKARIQTFIDKAGAERAKLEETIKAQEAERATQAREATAEALDTDLSVEGAIHKILTTKGFESGLNQLRDSIAKLSVAVSEAGKKFRRLEAEEAQAMRDLTDLEAIRKVAAMKKHFEGFCTSWLSAEIDHGEFKRLLNEVKASGADMKRVLKGAGIDERGFFGIVTDSSFAIRHSVVELVIELMNKSTIHGNVFYRANKEPAFHAGVSDFKKGSAFGGINFSNR